MLWLENVVRIGLRLRLDVAVVHHSQFQDCAVIDAVIPKWHRVAVTFCSADVIHAGTVHSKMVLDDVLGAVDVVCHRRRVE